MSIAPKATASAALLAGEAASTATLPTTSTSGILPHRNSIQGMRNSRFSSANSSAAAVPQPNSTIADSSVASSATSSASQGSSNAYGSSSYGYGSMMGGYGGYGMMGGYGGYGMMGGMMGGPFSLLYSVQQLVWTVSQVGGLAVMGCQWFYESCLWLWGQVREWERFVRQSVTRRWLQRKCRRSQTLRLVIVLTAMALSAAATRLVRVAIGLLISHFSGSPTPQIA